MNKVNWIAIATLGIVGLLALLVAVPLLLSLARGGDWGCGDGDSWGMMGGWRPGGMMGRWSSGPLGWFFGLAGLLIPLGFLALLVLGGVWLFKWASQPHRPLAGPTRAAVSQTCPSCGRPVETDWRICPDCDQGLA